MNKPYWLKLLKFMYLKERRTGLTIPFVIGAKEVGIEVSHDSIAELLKKIVGNSEQKVAIYFCQKIKEYVLSIDPNLLCGFIKNTRTFGNLIIIPSNDLNAIDELEHFISSFEAFYEPKIQASKFSKNNGSWNIFDNDDLTMIKNAYLFDHQN